MTVPEHDPASNLTQKTVKGVFWAYLSVIGGKGLTFLSTVILARLLLPEEFGEEERERALRSVPMGREGSAEDVARTVLFLLEGPDYITGAVIPVDGGRLLV